VLLVLLALLCVIFFFTRPHRLARITGDLLTQLTSAQVTIGYARIHYTGSIELDNVEFEVYSPQGKRLRLFHSDKVLLTQNLPSLFLGRFVARQLTFNSPTLFLTEDVDNRFFNYLLLQAAKEEDQKQEQKLPDSLPDIYIQNGTIQFGQIQGGVYERLGSIDVSGQLSTIPDQQGLYYYMLRQERQDDDAPVGPALSGQFNLNNLAFTARLEHFAIEEAHRQMLPSKLRAWWDQLQPRGSLPEVQFGYDPSLGMHAQLEVKDVAITLPGSDPPVTMSQVAGRFTMVGEKVAITQFKGLLEDVQYEINGQIDGLDKDAAFNITARTARFTIPQEPRYLLALPRAVQKQFQRFAPSGEFSALVNVKRTTPAGEILYDGQVEVDKAQGSYEKFPYPLKDVRGVLRFNNNELRIVNLHGTPLGGGRLSISGAITPPRDDAAMDIEISATDIPINEYLFNALDEDELDVVKAFFDEQALKRFTDKGLLQTREAQAEIVRQIEEIKTQNRNAPLSEELQQKLAALEKQAAIPVFDLGGMLNLHVHMIREEGPKKPYLPTTTIDVSRVSVITEPWSYPLVVHGGKLILAPGKATLDNIQVRGLDGLTGTVTGFITLPRKSVPGSKTAPNVEFAGTGMNISPLLLESLPPSQAKWIEELQIQGSLDLTGKVYRIDSNPMDFDIHATLRDAQAQPFAGRMRISPATGKMLIHRKSMVIESIQGQSDDASLVITGGASWQDKQTNLKLQIQGQNVEFSQPVLDLVPSHAPALETIRSELEIYRPTGRYDAHVDLTIEGKQDPQYTVTLLPRSVAFNFNDQRAVFEQFEGKVVIDPKKITLTDCIATYDRNSQAKFQGVITLGEKPVADVTLEALGHRLDFTTLALLPPGVAAFIRSNEVSSRYHLTEGRLIYRWNDRERVNFTGLTRLIDAKADLGVPITDLQGQLSVSAVQHTDSEWPVVDLKLQAARLRAWERVIEPLSLEMYSNNDQPGLLVIPSIRGQVYDGQLLGQGQVQLGDQPGYSLQMTLQDAQVEAVIEPESWKDIAPRQALDGSPYAGLSANLTLQGVPNEPDSRQGRGEIDVKNANLYQSPFALRLLQIISLTLPTARSFDRARASYVIDGDIVRFDNIRFETPSLALLGQGTLRFSTTELNLDFVSRRTTGPTLGPISDLVSVIKDQIVAIHVGGTLEQPVTQVRSFSGVGQSWSDLFKGKSADTATSPPATQSNQGRAGSR